MPSPAIQKRSTADLRGRIAALTGGKTGGHIFPVLAVGEELRLRGYGLLFFGSDQNMEGRLAAARGIEFIALPALPLVGAGVVQRLRALATLLRSSVAAWRLMRRRGVGVVIASGGFVCAPAVVAAALRRLPVILIEPNAMPGLANRMFSRVACWAAIAYQRTAGALHCPATVVGVPLRAEFEPEHDEGEGSPNEGNPSELDLVVLGGSQGAALFNREMPALLVTALRGTGARVLHQCGRGAEEETRSAYHDALEQEAKFQETRAEFGPVRPAEQAATRVVVQVVPFIDDMAEVMRRARLIVSRAGAITLAEVCAAGRPAVLIPLRLAAGHQGENARALADAGAAIVVQEGALDELVALVRELNSNAERRRTMGSAAHALHRPHAALVIADEVERAWRPAA